MGKKLQVGCRWVQRRSGGFSVFMRKMRCGLIWFGPGLQKLLSAPKPATPVMRRIFEHRPDLTWSRIAPILWNGLESGTQLCSGSTGDTQERPGLRSDLRPNIPPFSAIYRDHTYVQESDDVQSPANHACCPADLRD